MLVMRIFINVIVIITNDKVTGGWEQLVHFLKETSSVCFLGSGLNCTFHWKAQLLIFSKSEFNFFADISISWTFEKIELSSARILHIDVTPSRRSFIKIKNRRGPNTDPCEIPKFIFLQAFDHLTLLFAHDYFYD